MEYLYTIIFNKEPQMIINLIYTSIAGNTKKFIDNLIEFSQHNEINYQFKAIEISANTQLNTLDHPSFVFVPTYLDGGNGIHSGVKEILTTPLFEFLEDLPDTKNILGVIGSGNKNFNAQYVLTARRYAIKFGVPLIDNFELRGVPTDVERIFNNIMTRLDQKISNRPLQFKPTKAYQCISNAVTELIMIDENQQLVSPIFAVSNFNLSSQALDPIELERPEELYSIQVKALTIQHYWLVPRTI